MIKVEKNGARWVWLKVDTAPEMGGAYKIIERMKTSSPIIKDFFMVVFETIIHNVSTYGVIRRLGNKRNVAGCACIHGVLCTKGERSQRL